MSTGEDYVLLGLRLGKHVTGLVDSYYGPQDLKDAVDDEPPVHAAELASDAERLHGGLDDGWLRDQVRGLWTYARVLAGERLSYADEVEGCYGVRPQRTPESVFEDAHRALDELLPGDGSLFERRVAWRERHLVAGPDALRAFEALLPFFRERTARVVELPDGEEVEVGEAPGEPWWAFNHYLGNRRSRVVLNTDVPTTTLDLLHLVAHEVYPGHHTEHAVKEQRLYDDAGLVEEAIQLVPTPQAVLSEGIAETGLDIVLDDDARSEAYAILRRLGLPLGDPARAEAVAKAAEPLGGASLNAALLIHEDGASFDDAVDYFSRWVLRPPEQARRSVEFLTDPTWRAYTITYDAGRELCSAYVGGDARRFRTLVTEQVRIGDLQRIP